MLPFLSTLLISLVAGQTIDPALYSLGPNLIIQSTFSSPIVKNHHNLTQESEILLYNVNKMAD